MSEHVFYSTENRHNERQIRILSVGSLVSKPPTKEKRISVKVRMPLSGTVNMGAPEWLDSAFMYVARHHDTVTPNIEFKGYSIEFSTDNLFGEPIKSHDCIMRGFEIAEFGSEETPDVICSFTLRMQFSGPKWQWLGQFVGEDVWAKFTPGEAGVAHPQEEDGTLLDDGENDEEVDTDNEENSEAEGDEEDETIAEETDDPRVAVMPKKSGPTDIAAYHEKQLDAEQKRGRGRPRKTTVDPLTVNSISAEF